ncbi:class II histocompatibility antigen, B-L beta chain-like [Melospiza melodia melodia]
MGLGAAAGALLVALGVLGAPPGAGAELSGVFQYMLKAECYFINGTENVRFVQRQIYNREQYAMFDSDVGLWVGFTPFGEMNAKYWNSDPAILEHKRAQVDTYCRHNYEVSRPFITERRVPPSVSISLVPASSSQPGPGRLLCSVMDFYPAAIQVRWFQGQQELSEHVVATDVVANGDWTYQLLVLLETPPRRGLSYSCQVEHVSLEQPLRRHWEMPPDAGRSKMLTGIGGLVLGSVFVALGLGFYVRKKVRAGAGGGVAAVAEPPERDKGIRTKNSNGSQNRDPPKTPPWAPKIGGRVRASSGSSRGRLRAPSVALRAHRAGSVLLPGTRIRTGGTGNGGAAPQKTLSQWESGVE